MKKYLGKIEEKQYLQDIIVQFNSTRYKIIIRGRTSTNGSTDSAEFLYQYYCIKGEI